MKHIKFPPPCVRNCFSLAALTMLTLFSACRKEKAAPQQSSGFADPSANYRTVNPVADSAAINANTAAFYQTMKDIRDGANLSGNLSADSVEFVAEAVYNRYAVVQENGYDYPVVYVSFTVTETLDSSDLISYANIADAFWRIKDSLMVVYNNIDFDSDDKQLSLFDLTVDIESGMASFNVNGGIIRGPRILPLPRTCNRRFTDSTKAYSVSHNNTGSEVKPYNYGTGTFGTAYSGQNAPQMLRSYALHNYFCSMARPCGYWVNLGTTYREAIFDASILTTPVSDYVTRQITTYNNADMYLASYSKSCQNCQPNDPQLDYKWYLNSEMMNFYLVRIPNHISASLPTGKHLADFKITHTVGGGAWGSGSYWWIPMHHIYEIKHGNYIIYCGSGVGLPNM